MAVIVAIPGRAQAGEEQHSQAGAAHPGRQQKESDSIAIGRRIDWNADREQLQLQPENESSSCWAK